MLTDFKLIKNEIIIIFKVTKEYLNAVRWMQKQG